MAPSHLLIACLLNVVLATCLLAFSSRVECFKCPWFGYYVPRSKRRLYQSVEKTQTLRLRLLADLFHSLHIHYWSCNRYQVVCGCTIVMVIIYWLQGDSDPELE